MKNNKYRECRYCPYEQMGNCTLSENDQRDMQRVETEPIYGEYDGCTPTKIPGYPDLPHLLNDKSFKVMVNHGTGDVYYTNSDDDQHLGNDGLSQWTMIDYGLTEKEAIDVYNKFKEGEC